MRVLVATALALALVAPLSAQSAQPAQPAAKTLSVDEAVRLALASDGRAESAFWDAQAADKKAEEAQRRMYPSLNVQAGYTRISDLTSTIAFGALTIPISSLENNFTLSANLQYPVFAGFRLRESANLASLQARGKAVSAEMTRRAIEFETRRAYWEAVRATNNARLLGENLELARRNADIAERQFAQGTAINADLLVANMRRDQAEMDLSAARTSVSSRLFPLTGTFPPTPRAIPIMDTRFRRDRKSCRKRLPRAARSRSRSTRAPSSRAR